MFDSFAHNFSQAKSVQAVIRAMSIFANSFPGECEINIKSMGDGAVANFGAPPEAAKHGGHDKFLSILNDVEELMSLEYALKKMQEAGADPQVVEKVLKEASVLAKKLYPKAS